MTDCKITIIKVEGLGDLSHVDCLVSEKGGRVDRVPLSSSMHQPVLVASSLLRFILIDLPSSLPISSLSFDLSIIKRPGLHWFPLFLNEEDYIKEVPEEVGLPRVLVDINPEILAPIIEITESSDTNDDLLEEASIDSSLKSKNVELMIKALDLEAEINRLTKKYEEKIDSIEKEYKEKIEKLMSEAESSRNNLAHQAKISGDFIRENERIKERAKEVSEENLKLKVQVVKYEGMYEEVKLREDSILMLLEEKDKEIMILTRQIQAGHSPSSKSDLKSPQTRTSKTPDVSLKKAQPPSKFSVLQQIDSKIQDTLKLLGLEGLLKLSDEFIYTLQNKKINIVLKKDTVYVKSGLNSFKTLESFIGSSCGQEIKNFLTRKKQKVLVQNLHRRSSTINELETLPSAIISKTFDLKIPKPQRVYKKLLSPNARKSFSPLSKVKSARHV